MDPVSMTLGAITARLIARAQDRTIDATITEGEGVLRRLVESVRARFIAQNDTKAVETLELVERVPDSDQLVSELAASIDKQAQDDEAFKAQLKELVAQADAGGLTVNNVRQTASGDGIIQLGGIVASKITIDR